MGLRELDLAVEGRSFSSELPANPLGRVCEGILDAVGGTPLVRLSRYFPDRRITVLAKVEALNPGGSIKDRPALWILKSAIERGEIGPGTTDT